MALSDGYVVVQLAATIIAVSWDFFELTLIPVVGRNPGVRNLERWDAQGLQQLDEAFVDTFGTFAESRVAIGGLTDEYRAKLRLLSQKCKAAAQDVLVRQKVVGIPEDKSLPDDVVRVLKWRSNPDDIPIPFPTRSFVTYVFDLFESIPKSVNEVSLLNKFPPMCDLDIRGQS